MKALIIGLILILLICLFAVHDSQAQNANLTIKIAGIEKVVGKIQIGIYNDACKFPKEGEQYKVIIFSVTSKIMTYKIGLPVGSYAIALMHDEDADGECDKNFLGLPTEGYGFSNNVKPKLSAPSFDETKIELISDKIIQIDLIY